MERFDYRNIEKVPGRCGGQPVIVGTRIRVATILVWYRQGMSIEEIVQLYSIFGHPTSTMLSPTRTTTWKRLKRPSPPMTKRPPREKLPRRAPDESNRRLKCLSDW